MPSNPSYKVLPIALVRKVLEEHPCLMTDADRRYFESLSAFAKSYVPRYRRGYILLHTRLDGTIYPMRVGTRRKLTAVVVQDEMSADIAALL